MRKVIFFGWKETVVQCYKMQDIRMQIFPQRTPGRQRQCWMIAQTKPPIAQTLLLSNEEDMRLKPSAHAKCRSIIAVVQPIKNEFETEIRFCKEIRGWFLLSGLLHPSTNPKTPRGRDYGLRRNRCRGKHRKSSVGGEKLQWIIISSDRNGVAGRCRCAPQMSYCMLCLVCLVYSGIVWYCMVWHVNVWNCMV